MSLTPTDTAKRTNSPPLQGRGWGWGLSANNLTDLKQRARNIRRDPTEPEQRLWRAVSGSRFEGMKFRRQEVIGRCIVDFWCPAAGLAVEVDGDTHSDPDRVARRDAYLKQIGVRVLHVTNSDVMRNIEGVIAVIAQVLREAGGPHHNPSPEGERLS